MDMVRWQLPFYPYFGQPTLPLPQGKVVFLFLKKTGNGEPQLAAII